MHGALGAAFLFVVAGGTAQVPHAWTFDELTAKADLVIIASHLSTQDTGRRRMDPELKPGARAAELRTELKVLQVLKADHARGVAAGATLSLRHYSVLEPPFSMGSTLKFGESARAYLVFLARKPDGVYEPVSGQVFPADSVYLLDRSDHIPPPLPPSLPNMSGTWVLINVNDAPRDAARELVVTQDPRVFGVSAAAGAIPMSRTYALGVSGGVVSSDGGRDNHLPRAGRFRTGLHLEIRGMDRRRRSLDHSSQGTPRGRDHTGNDARVSPCSLMRAAADE